MYNNKANRPIEVNNSIKKLDKTFKPEVKTLISLKRFLIILEEFIENNLNEIKTIVDFL